MHSLLIFAWPHKNGRNIDNGDVIKGERPGWDNLGTETLMRKLTVELEDSLVNLAFVRGEEEGKTEM